VYQYLAEIVSGLAEIHAANIIHRDIKPGNILVAESGELKIADFELAKFLSGSIPLAHSFAGTLEYMSPEMLAGQPYATASSFPFATPFSVHPDTLSRRTFSRWVQLRVSCSRVRHRRNLTLFHVATPHQLLLQTR
jgi:serine/threonine protein kinase